MVLFQVQITINASSRDLASLSKHIKYFFFFYLKCSYASNFITLVQAGVELLPPKDQD